MFAKRNIKIVTKGRRKKNLHGAKSLTPRGGIPNSLAICILAHGSFDSLDSTYWLRQFSGSPMNPAQRMIMLLVKEVPAQYFPPVKGQSKELVSTLLCTGQIMSNRGIISRVIALRRQQRNPQVIVNPRSQISHFESAVKR
jgi:hypothetical protein